MATTPDDGLLTRTVRVLETLAGSEQPTTLPLLAARVGVSTSQTYRALRALQSEGFVDHVGRRGYRLGTRALSLGVLLGPRPEVRAIARPLLAWLAAQLGLTARLHLRSGPDRVLTFVALAPTEPDVPAQTVIGERAGLTRGCSGRAILAHLEPDDVDEVIRLRPPGGNPTAFRSELGRIRSVGHAISHAHNHAGRRGISVPLRSPEHPGPLGAVSLSAPEDRIDDTGLRALLGPLNVTVHELGGRLGTVLGPAPPHAPTLSTSRPPDPRQDRRASGTTDAFHIGRARPRLPLSFEHLGTHATHKRWSNRCARLQTSTLADMAAAFLHNALHRHDLPGSDRVAGPSRTSAPWRPAASTVRVTDLGAVGLRTGQLRQSSRAEDRRRSTARRPSQWRATSGGGVR